MILGMDYIGGANYLHRIAKNHPLDFAGGCLVRAGGWPSGLKVARTLAELQVPAIRVHGTWHDNHFFTDKDIPQAVRIGERVANLAMKFKHTKFYYSPWLEPHVSEKQMRRCKRAVRKVLPRRVQFVQGRYLRRGVNETHHSHYWGGRCIVSYDGVDMLEKSCVELELDAGFYSGAEIFFGWIWKFNGLENGWDTTPRRCRRNWPKRRDFRQVQRTLRWMYPDIE